MDTKVFKYCFKICAPVILGYIPAGFAFGLMITSQGFNIITSLIMSSFIYAGAGQYLAVDFFAKNISIFQMALMTFLINSKHMFYGLSLLDEFKNMGSKKKYMIFSLTDETYAVLTGTKIPESLDKNKCIFYISVINHISWIIGTFLGAVIGSSIKFNTAGLDFAMTALFLVILIEQLKSFKTKYPFIIGIISALSAWIILGKSNIILGGAVISVTLFIILKKRIEKSDN